MPANFRPLDGRNGGDSIRWKSFRPCYGPAFSPSGTAALRILDNPEIAKPSRISATYAKARAMTWTLSTSEKAMSGPWGAKLARTNPIAEYAAISNSNNAPIRLGSRRNHLAKSATSNSPAAIRRVAPRNTSRGLMGSRSGELRRMNQIKAIGIAGHSRRRAAEANVLLETLWATWAPVSVMGRRCCQLRPATAVANNR